jgi:hypothetical protein
MGSVTDAMTSSGINSAGKGLARKTQISGMLQSHTQTKDQMAASAMTSNNNLAVNYAKTNTGS